MTMEHSPIVSFQYSSPYDFFDTLKTLRLRLDLYIWLDYSQEIHIHNQQTCLYKQKNELHFCNSFFVAGPGIEPGTSWLWIMRSNQLSYPAIVSWLRVQR